MRLVPTCTNKLLLKDLLLPAVWPAVCLLVLRPAVRPLPLHPAARPAVCPVGPDDLLDLLGAQHRVGREDGPGLAGMWACVFGVCVCVCVVCRSAWPTVWGDNDRCSLRFFDWMSYPIRVFLMLSSEYKIIFTSFAEKANQQIRA